MGATTMTPGTSTANGGAPAVRPVPFTRASIEHTEPAGVRSSALLTTNAQQVGPAAISAFGYMAFLTLVVTATGGNNGAATVAYAGDAPFSVLSEVTLQDINGTPIVQLSGYELMLANVFGGYDYAPAPQGSPNYTTPDADGNFSFTVRVPVQLRQRDALGCLPNMNAAASYQIKWTVAGSAGIYSTPPDTLPTVTVDARLHAWALPPAGSVTGAPQATQPPCVGTTQYWTRQAGQTVNAGQNDLQLTRVGNLIRNLIVIGRDANGVRDDGALLDPFQLKWDGRIVLDETLAVRRDLTYHRVGFPIAGLPFTGVMVIDLTHSFTGHPGDGDLSDLWYPTASSTRLDYSGVAADGGSVTVLTNDVIPVGDIFSLD